MPKFQFTGEVPMIFANLSYGPDVVAEHAPDTEWPDHDPEGSTVTLYPGDTVTVPDGYPEHAYLEPLEIEGKKISIAELRDELTARGIEFDPKAKKTDLEALLAPELDVITENGIATSGDATEIILSGPAADTSSTSITSPEE